MWQSLQPQIQPLPPQEGKTPWGRRNSSVWECWFGLFDKKEENNKKEYNCNKCDFKGLNNWKLKRHLETKHNLQSEFKPLITNNLDSNIIDLYPPPSLHCVRLGALNKIYSELVKHIDLKDFEKTLNLTRSEYHGGHFEGNESKKILQNVSKLNIKVDKRCIIFRGSTSCNTSHGLNLYNSNSSIVPVFYVA